MPLPSPDLSEFTTPELIDELRGRQDFGMVLDEMTYRQIFNYLEDRIKAEKLAFRLQAGKEEK